MPCKILLRNVIYSNTNINTVNENKRISVHAITVNART